MPMVKRLMRAGPPFAVDVPGSGLASWATDPYRSYSLGTKQRLGIAAALLPSPRLLVMDEPTNGLDPAGILQNRDLILRFREEGMTVLVSSHLPSEVEQVADHLVMIRAGRMVFQGSVVDLVPERWAPGFLSLPHAVELGGGEVAAAVRRTGPQARIVDLVREVPRCLVVRRPHATVAVSSGHGRRHTGDSRTERPSVANDARVVPAHVH
jgi:ABC-2 type transport system ATP-binding protein